jgi:putative ABC transport system ATP-binding protein
MAGLDMPEQGEVLVEGIDVAGLADHQLADLRLRTLGFVFQSFNLIPALTVAENVAWPLEFSGCRPADVRIRTGGALARVGMAGREPRHPGELSGGEQQRVAIARAIVTRPSILLAPTGNLDTHTGQQILDLLAVLSRDDRVTVVMVTHNVAAAMYGDRTLEMQDGRIVREVRTPATSPGDVGPRDWPTPTRPSISAAAQNRTWASLSGRGNHPNGRNTTVGLGIDFSILEPVFQLACGDADDGTLCGTRAPPCTAGWYAMPLSACSPHTASFALA